MKMLHVQTRCQDTLVNAIKVISVMVSVNAKVNLLNLLRIITAMANVIYKYILITEMR